MKNFSEIIGTYWLPESEDIKIQGKIIEDDEDTKLLLNLEESTESRGFYSRDLSE